MVMMRLLALFAFLAHTADAYTVTRDGDFATVHSYWGLDLSPRNASARWDARAPNCERRPIPMYAFPPRTADIEPFHRIFSRIFASVHPSPDVEWTESPETACVCFASDPDAGSCRNTALVAPNVWPGEHMDRPGTTRPAPNAALVMPSHVPGEFIPNFDVMLPRLRSDFFDDTGCSTITAGTAPRTLLVFFAGTAERGWPMPWYDKRIELDKFHNPERGVDVTVLPNTRASRRADYAAKMRSAHFALIVGGGGVDTYRFFEALAYGAVPVVVHDDLILPLAIEEWPQCVLRFESIDHLESITAVEREARREACARIFTHHFACISSIQRRIVHLVGTFLIGEA